MAYRRTTRILEELSSELEKARDVTKEEVTVHFSISSKDLDSILGALDVATDGLWRLGDLEE